MSGAFSQNDAKRLERRPPGTARRACNTERAVPGGRRSGFSEVTMRSRNRQTLAAGFCSLSLSVFTSLAAVVHEWNFNETSGTMIFDSVGAAHAQIVTLPGGGGYRLDGKRVRLEGGTRSNADYVLFPENTFERLTNVTVEVWAIQSPELRSMADRQFRFDE